MRTSTLLNVNNSMPTSKSMAPIRWRPLNWPIAKAQNWHNSRDLYQTSSMSSLNSVIWTQMTFGSTRFSLRCAILRSDQCIYSATSNASHTISHSSSDWMLVSLVSIVILNASGKSSTENDIVGRVQRGNYKNGERSRAALGEPADQQHYEV